MLLLCAGLALSAATARAGEPGSAGALFLRVGVGARASGMGEAFTAIAGDASAVYWNPGAMPAVLGTDVVLVHNEYLQSIRVEQAALTHETDRGTLGLAFTGLFTGDMERRDDAPTADPLGEFGASDIAFSLAFGRYVVPNVAVGASVKGIVQKIDQEDANGFAVDLGIYHVSRVEGLKLAAVVGNLGKPMKFLEEEYALPRYVKVGGSYARGIAAIRGGVQLALDLVFPNDGDGRQHAGVEFDYERRFFLRAGYKAGYESQGATFGLGARHREFSVDYAWLPVGNDLGDSHRI
jgi:hypothetical protein